MRNRFTSDIELIESRNGVFEITVDDQLFFSKQLTGHFPNIERLIKDIEKNR